MENPLRDWKIMKKFVLSLLALASLLPLAEAQVTSVLWGVNGEAWNTNGLLRDFTTDMGYQGNGAALPDWPVGVNITNFGGVADDLGSDVDALLAAISNCPPYHAVFLPDGRYIIDDFINVPSNNIVIRGESRDGTILFFPKHANEIKNVVEDTTRMIRFSGGTNRGIEHLSLVFRDEQKATGAIPSKVNDPHWFYNGENPIEFDEGENNSWMRDIYIRNANHPINIDQNSRYITVLDVVLDNFIGRKCVNGASDGHMGIRLGYGTKHCLIHNILLTGRYVHDICPMGGQYNVFSRIRGPNIRIDHHAAGNRGNLYTEFDLGIGDNIGSSVGNGISETYWGFNSQKNISYRPTNQQWTVVGIKTTEPTDIGPTWHHETLDPVLLEPANIWLAQMAYNNNTNTPPETTLTLPPLTAPYQIPPTDTAQVYGGSNSNVNYKYGRTFQLKGASGSGNIHDRRGLMKWDLSGLGITNVANATFRFYHGGSPNLFGLRVMDISDDSWSEQTVTFANMPADGSLIATTNWLAAGWCELDLTSYVNSELAGDQKVSLAMRAGGPGETQTAFTSIYTYHAGNGPLLVLHTEASTVPPPAQPTGLVATPGDNRAMLDWDDNTENDFATYNVYRSKASESNYVIDAMGLISSDYDGSYVTNNGGAYYFKVAAVDTAGTESILSREVMVIPAPPGNQAPAFTSDPILGIDVAEGSVYSSTIADDASDPESDPMTFSKVSGPAWLGVASDGMLSGTPAFSDVGLNSFTVQVDAVGGSDTATLEITVDPGSQTTIRYEAEDAVLSGPQVSSSQSGYSGTGFADYVNDSNDYIEWTVSAASAGSAELVFGYALSSGDRPLEIRVNGAVVEASLSFPATGDWSLWGETTPVSVSLLAGPNTVRATAIGSSGGNLDYLEVSMEAEDTNAPAAPTGLAATPGDSSVSLDWDDNSEGDLDSYSVYRSTTSGSYASALTNGLASSDYTDNTVSNATTYYYTVTATDTNGNQSAQSAEVSATPTEVSLGTLWTGNINTDLNTSGNWDNGLPDSAINNGQIDAGAGTLTGEPGGLFVTQNGGSYVADDRKFIGSGSWAVGSGAVFDMSSKRLFIQNGQVFNIQGGSVTNVEKFRLGQAGTGSTFLMTGGSFDMNQFAFLSDSVATIGGTNTGTISANSITFEETAILNWLTGTRVAMAVSGSSAWAENAWNSNRLLYNGQSKNDLGNRPWADVTDSGVGLGDGSHFVFNTNTLSLASSALTGYDQWAAGWSNSIGAATNDFDSDGLNNLYEYAFDGNPTNGLAPTNLPLFTKSGSGFLYIHPQRSDDPNLIYTVETTTNLMDSGAWTNEGYTVTGTNITGGTLNFVTNDVDTVQNEQFIRLKIEQ